MSTIVTGVPATECRDLADPTRVRPVAELRCTGCKETFANLVAAAGEPVLIYRPVLWEHPEFVWWDETVSSRPGHSWNLRIDSRAGKRQHRARVRYALTLTDPDPILDRVVLACRCRHRPHLADPAVLRRFVVDGGTGVVPGQPAVRRVIPVAAGECIDGINRELFGKVQRRRRPLAAPTETHDT